MTSPDDNDARNDGPVRREKAEESSVPAGAAPGEEHRTRAIRPEQPPARTTALSPTAPPDEGHAAIHRLPLSRLVNQLRDLHPTFKSQYAAVAHGVSALALLVEVARIPAKDKAKDKWVRCTLRVEPAEAPPDAAGKAADAPPPILAQERKEGVEATSSDPGPPPPPGDFAIKPPCEKSTDADPEKAEVPPASTEVMSAEGGEGTEDPGVKEEWSWGRFGFDVPIPAWACYLSLVLVSACLALLVLLYRKPDPRPEVLPPSPPDPSPVSGKIDGVQASLDRLHQGLRDLAAKKIDLPDKFPKVELPENLAAEVARKVVVSGPVELKPETIQKLADATTTAVAAKVKELTAKISLSDADRSKVVNDVKEAVRGEMARVGPGTRPQAAFADGTDVFLVITHGRAMDANAYKGALGAVLRDVPRGKEAAVRVGLAVATTNKLAVKVPLDAERAAVDSFAEPAQEDDESPRGFGEQLKARFDPRRARQRAVLLVTPGCDPLLPDSPGWNEIREVHVVLLARKDLGVKDRERLASWHEFAGARRGTVTLIGNPSDVGRQNEALRACLDRLVRPAD